MQPISMHHYSTPAGAKTGVAGKPGNSGRKPVRRRRRQQRRGAESILDRLAGEAVRRYAQR